MICVVFLFHIITMITCVTNFCSLEEKRFVLSSIIIHNTKCSYSKMAAKLELARHVTQRK